MRTKASNMSNFFFLSTRYLAATPIPSYLMPLTIHTSKNSKFTLEVFLLMNSPIGLLHVPTTLLSLLPFSVLFPKCSFLLLLCFFFQLLHSLYEKLKNNNNLNLGFPISHAQFMPNEWFFLDEHVSSDEYSYRTPPPKTPKIHRLGYWRHRQYILYPTKLIKEIWTKNFVLLGIGGTANIPSPIIFYLFFIFSSLTLKDIGGTTNNHCLTWTFFPLHLQGIGSDANTPSPIKNILFSYTSKVLAALPIPLALSNTDIFCIANICNCTKSHVCFSTSWLLVALQIPVALPIFLLLTYEVLAAPPIP